MEKAQKNKWRIKIGIKENKTERNNDIIKVFIYQLMHKIDALKEC